MKTLNIFYSFILICITFVGCSKDEVNILTITPQQVNISANGGSGSITLKTDAKSWNIVNSASDWLKVSSTSGNIKNTAITLSVTTRSLEARSATLTVSAGNANPVLVTIAQPGSEFIYTLTSELSTLEFKKEGETKLLKIETTSPQWSLSADADWLQFDKSSGLDGNKTISVTALQNSGLVRTATISIISDHAQMAQVQVQQDGDLYPHYNTSPMDPDATGMSSNAVELSAKMKLGWNLGNTLEATSGTVGNETLWGNPLTTKAFIDLVKATGFNAIRLPCAWNGYANQTTAEIKLSWLNRVKEVVQYCLDNDMYVLLNIHWDGGWLDANINLTKQEEIKAKQKAFWEQIATTMRDFDEHVMFASANEPPVNNAAEMGILLSYHQSFVDAVRSTGGHNSYRVLVIQGPSTDILKTDDLMNTLPVDQVEGRTMVEIHNYTPFQFTLMDGDADWGKMFYYWGKDYHSGIEPDRNATWGEEDEQISYFQKMKEKFVDKGIPVILGEYGAYGREGSSHVPMDLEMHKKSVDHWATFVTREALAHGVIPFWWDTGGALDRTNLTVKDQRTINALKAAAE
jgi:endoglucanase